MSRSIAAWIEPHEEVPRDIDAWLEGWGFDVTKPIQRKVDPEGWTWWLQEVADVVLTPEKETKAIEAKAAKYGL